MTAVEGNTSVCQVYPANGATGEGRAEIVQGMGTGGGGGRGSRGGAATQSGQQQ